MRAARLSWAVVKEELLNLNPKSLVLSGGIKFYDE